MIENQVNIPEMNEIEYQRLTNDRNGMFKRWSVITNNTAIAQFMREGIDPTKEYTKRELTELWKQYAKESFSHLFERVSGKSLGYGQIIIKHNDVYKLHPKLVLKFNEFF
jgi:hypothetical protein